MFKDDLFYKSIDVSDDVYKDTNINTWAESLPKCDGSKLLMNKLMSRPISDENLLKLRQNSYCIPYIDFNNLKDCEDDVLWVYKLNDEIKDNNLINVLFPSTFLVSYINYVNPLLELYHLYKIYLIPMNVLIYPVMALFAPLYYVNKYMGLNISLSYYISLMIKFTKLLFTYTGDLKSMIVRIATIAVYIFLFGYNVYQTLEYSYLLYDMKRVLYEKLCNMNTFLRESISIIKTVPKDLIRNFVKLDIEDALDMDTSDNISGVYKTWKSDKLKEKIAKILTGIYTVDIINSITQLKTTKNWCVVDYTDNTRIWNMKNPLLSHKQVANPMDLSKNVIITGPNAAGKTTYVKSILSNVILSQTIGLVNGLKADMMLYDSIVSFMRISDILGSKSYFEMEAEYCVRMMAKAKELSECGKKGLFMMDEPMHSTPPTEGMSTAYAVAEYIGNMANTNIIITTHFHKLTNLETNYPKKFLNLSVEAIEEDGGFKFPYEIRRGHSYQCIAIELLGSKHFPEEVIASAIKMKNKICNENNSR